MWPELDEILGPDGRMSHKFGMGPWTTRIEEAFAKKHGFRYCVVFPAGTPALITRMMDIQKASFQFFVLHVQAFPGVWLALIDRKDHWEMLKKFASQGYDFTSDLGENKVDSIGMNFRVTELMAAAIYHMEFGNN